MKGATVKDLMVACMISTGVALSAIVCVIYMASRLADIEVEVGREKHLDARLSAVEILACELKEDHTWVFTKPCSRGCKSAGFRKK